MAWMTTRPGIHEIRPAGCTGSCRQGRLACTCPAGDDRHRRQELRQSHVIRPTASWFAETHAATSRLHLVQDDGGGRHSRVWQPSKPVRPYCRKHWGVRAWCDLIPALRPLARLVF